MEEPVPVPGARPREEEEEEEPVECTRRWPPGAVAPPVPLWSPLAPAVAWAREVMVLARAASPPADESEGPE